MSVSFIPNQPFIFELPIGAYPCLNTDDRHYAQLVQPGDKLCVQWIMNPCESDVECEPNMYNLIDSQEVKEWIVSEQWFSNNTSELSYVGDNGVPSIPQSDLVNTPVVGAVYRLDFNVVITGQATFSIALGISSAVVTQSGTYTFYFICTTNTDKLEVLVNPAATDPADTIYIDQLILRQVTTCWLDELNFNSPSWDYSYNGSYGKFCSRDVTGGDLINLSGYTTAGNYHSVSFVIDSCTQGQIEVEIGSVTIGTTSGNGSFTFYGIPTSGSGELRFKKINEFDGCISQVDVNDFGNPTTRFNVYFFNLGNTWTISQLPTWYDDRVVLCTDWTTLDPDVGGCDLIQIRISEECDDEIIYYYDSINYANYNAAGWECTKVVESWNDGYAYGFYFGDINSPDFTLVQRLRVLQFNPVYPNEGEEYLYSNGSYTRSFGQTGKRRQAWFDYVDEACHDTIRVQLMSSKLFVDNYAFYYPIENYEPEWAENGKYNLAQSRVILVHEEVLFSSPCGALANPICPPQNVVQPLTNISAAFSFKQDLLENAPGIPYEIDGFYIRQTDINGNIIFEGNLGSFYQIDTIGGRVSIVNDICAILETQYPGSSFTGNCYFISAGIGMYNFELNINGSGDFGYNPAGISICLNPYSVNFAYTNPGTWGYAIGALSYSTT